MLRGVIVRVNTVVQMYGHQMLWLKANGMGEPVQPHMYGYGAQPKYQGDAADN